MNLNVEICEWSLSIILANQKGVMDGWLNAWMFVAMYVILFSSCWLVILPLIFSLEFIQIWVKMILFIWILLLSTGAREWSTLLLLLVGR